MSGYDPATVIEYTRRTLEQAKVGVSVTSTLDYQVDVSVFSDHLAHRLAAYVLRDHICDDTYTAHTDVQWPETTWQMFKQRHGRSWWLGWLVRRRPVRMHCERHDVAVQVSRYLTYPESTLMVSGLGRPVILEQPRQIPWGER